MYQGNAAHTGFVPLDIDPNKIQKLWQVNLGQIDTPGISYIVYPATIGKKYVMVSNSHSHTLEAFSFKNGRLKWSKSFNSTVQPSAYSDGTIFVQTVNNYSPSTLLRAYKENDGELVFESPFTAQWQNYNAPVIDNNVVYACSGYMSGLTAYNTNSGEELWSTTFMDLSEGATSAVNKNHVLYYNAGYLLKLSKTTGDLISQIKDPKWTWQGYTDVTPVLYKNRFAFVTVNHYLTKFNLEKDKVDFSLDNVTSTPSVDTQNIYVIRNQKLTAIDVLTGKTLWESKETFTDSIEDILVTNNLVFISDGNETIAFSKTDEHEAIWKEPIGGKLSLSTRGLFIVSPEGKLTAYRFNE